MGGVEVSQSVPSEMKPGAEYTIEITVNKGATGGFAKFQQDLPEGFTAVAIESKGASFSQSGTAVKFIWTSLPSDPEFKISYKVTVAQSVTSGEKMVGGKFFYVVDNAKQSVELIPTKVTISGGTVANTNTTNTQTTDNTNTNNQNTNNQTTNTNTQTTDNTQQGPISCKRKITSNGGNDYTVEMTINKGAIAGFAKLNENIPAGFTASAGQLNKGSFSFNEQKIKIVWVTLPQEPEFTISYKLTGSAAVAAQIDGLLSYIENEETKKYVIAASAIGTNAVSANNQTTNTNNTNTNTTTTQAADTAKVNTQVSNNTNTNNQTTNNTNTNNNNTQTPDNTNTTITPTMGNVNYRVQICALKMSRMDNTYFETKYSFSKVDMEQHEGWIKYLVGGFSEYRKARDYREEARGKGVVGPFVTAYNSGRRITVQEALMITTQQWYK